MILGSVDLKTIILSVEVNYQLRITKNNGGHHIH